MPLSRHQWCQPQRIVDDLTMIENAVEARLKERRVRDPTDRNKPHRRYATNEKAVKRDRALKQSLVDDELPHAWFVHHPWQVPEPVKTVVAIERVAVPVRAPIWGRGRGKPQTVVVPKAKVLPVASLKRTKGLDCAVRGKPRMMCRFHHVDSPCESGLACRSLHMKFDEEPVQRSAPRIRFNSRRLRCVSEPLAVASRFEVLDTHTQVKADPGNLTVLPIPSNVEAAPLVLETARPEPIEAETEAVEFVPEATLAGQTISVRGLPRHATEESMIRLFGSIGGCSASILSVAIDRDDVFGFCSGSAVITTSHWEEKFGDTIRQLGYGYSFQQSGAYNAAAVDR